MLINLDESASRGVHHGGPSSHEGPDGSFDNAALFFSCDSRSTYRSQTQRLPEPMRKQGLWQLEAVVRLFIDITVGELSGAPD